MAADGHLVVRCGLWHIRGDQNPAVQGLVAERTEGRLLSANDPPRLSWSPAKSTSPVLQRENYIDRLSFGCFDTPENDRKQLNG
jgi:hypothetical protein